MAARTWTSQEKELHIDVLEMKAVQVVLNAFLPWIMGGWGGGGIWS